MLGKRWCALMIILISVLMCAEEAISSGSKYNVYGNARFGYEISYPGDIFVPQGEATNGDGQKFISKDNEAVAVVYGSNNALDETLKSKYEEVIGQSSSGSKINNVTYKRLRDNWFVVSGEEGKKIYYVKTLLINDVFITFKIEYSKSKKNIYDPIVAVMSKSFMMIPK